MEEEEDEEYERVLSVLREAEGSSEDYSEISKFKDYLKAANLEDEKLERGWVLYEQQVEDEVQDRIITLLKHLIHAQTVRFHCLIQFWAVVEVEGQHCRLSTKHQPFCVPYLDKGLCWYRKRCTDYVYDGAEGGVGRAYQKKQSESTPDLRLYSTEEFPMRDYATRSGFKGYLALPLFALRTNICYGVLELLSGFTIMEAFLLSSLDQGLQIAELRSTHTNSIPISRYTTNMPKHQPVETEITEILKLAIKAIPGLYLAQVWVPCKQCPNKSSNLCCMNRASFINSRSKKINTCDDTDSDMLAYLQACEFHNLQIDLGCIHQNSCDLSISQNPLAHYAARARLSFRHTIHLISVHNNSDLDTYVIEFFLQPNCRRDACGDSSLQLLSRIMEVKLHNFKLASGRQQLRRPSAIELESVDMLKVLTNLHKETFSEQDFTEYLDMVELCGVRLPSLGIENGWVFSRPAGEDSESLHAGVPVKNKIELFLKLIAARFRKNCYSMVQFWAPERVEDKCYLETSYQPYAIDCLAKGLASFRKECMKHRYRVDHGAKAEELGPPGRVFRNGLPEISPDLTFYYTEEFSLRNYAVHCGFREYFVLPVFDEDKHMCMGVLEFIGFSYFELDSIKGALEEVKLRSTLNSSFPRFLGSSGEEDNDITLCRKKALTEIRDAIYLITKIPQLYMANVWVPYEEEGVGINTNARCMELAMFSESPSQFMPTDHVHRVHVRPRKGIIGTVLASESQSCFCRNLRGFGIADQPRLHYEMSDRCDVCFAICLQSSHTGDLVYVLEFFLYQGPAIYEYLNSFLNFLLPIMKHRLKTFKMASGKQIGEEFVVEVMEFSDANKRTSSKPDKFKSVLYGQEEHQQYLEEQQVQSNSVYNATQTSLTEECSAAAPRSGFKKTKERKRKLDPQLSLEVLTKHFGKKLKDVEKELQCSKSKIKRDCRLHGIARWPNKMKNAKSASTTSSLSERECSWDPKRDLQTSSRSNLLQLDSSSQHVTVEEGAEKVIVKVKYKKDTIKFESRLSMEVAKLCEEVATKLNLKQEDFKLKYVDEDKDEILLTWDANLQLCPKSRTATGRTCINLFVELNSM